VTSEDIYKETKTHFQEVVDNTSDLQLVTDGSANMAKVHIENTSFLIDGVSFYHASTSIGFQTASAQLTNKNKSVWEIMNSTTETRDVLTVPCDSHGLQLIFKDLLWPGKDNQGNSSSAMVEFFKSSLNADLALLRSVMQICYSKIRAPIKTTPTRWGTQIAQIDSICNSENALKGYIAHPDATSSTIKSLLSASQFWQKLSRLQLFFKPIHTHQKTSESNGATLNKVYPR
ncbi:hypothetical protein GcM1_136006, partial [Golovinomyces cichoracearum]